MKLITLTPIHIGSGESLKPLSYITDRNLLYVLDMDKFFAVLSEAQREIYLQWMDPILNRLAQLDERIAQARADRNQKRRLQSQRREEEKKLSVRWFIENRLGQNPISFAKKCLAYQISYFITPGRDGFKTHIKDTQNQAYIPGSEIKGAIRTSLLYTMLQNGQNYKILKDSLTDFKSVLRSGKSPKKKIEKLKKLANAQDENGLERKLLRGSKRDAKFDFLKFIRISDSSSIESQKLKIETTQMLRTDRYTKTWVETIVPNTQLYFDFSTQEKAFLDKLGLNGMKNWLSVPKLLEACHHRSKEILEEEERHFSDERNILDLIRRLKKENQPTSPLLRLGAGQGFLGTTIDLKVLKEDPQLYDEAIREGVSFQRRWRTQKGNFPKTRRVIVDSYNNPSAILGWIKLLPD